jgi:uncharacterized Fe-S center protein
VKKKELSSVESEENKFDELFEESDMSESIKSGTVMDLSKKVGRPQIGEKISVTIPPIIIEKLREAAAKRHIGYQTMLRIILAENVNKY